MPPTVSNGIFKINDLLVLSALLLNIIPQIRLFCNHLIDKDDYVLYTNNLKFINGFAVIPKEKGFYVIDEGGNIVSEVDSGYEATRLNNDIIETVKQIGTGKISFFHRFSLYIDAIFL